MKTLTAITLALACLTSAASSEAGGSKGPLFESAALANGTHRMWKASFRVGEATVFQVQSDRHSILGCSVYDSKLGLIDSANTWYNGVCRLEFTPTKEQGSHFYIVIENTGDNYSQFIMISN